VQRRIEEQKRHVAPMRRGDQVRPQIELEEYERARSQCVERPSDRCRRVLGQVFAVLRFAEPLRELVTGRREERVQDRCVRIALAHQGRDRPRLFVFADRRRVHPQDAPRVGPPNGRQPFLHAGTARSPARSFDVAVPRRTHTPPGKSSCRPTARWKPAMRPTPSPALRLANTFDGGERGVDRDRLHALVRRPEAGRCCL
jgi:hypothetical protein